MMQALERSPSPEIRRFDLVCKNCTRFDTRTHSVRNHHDTGGCVEKLPNGMKCPCDWAYDQVEGTKPAKKIGLGDFV